MAISKSAKDNWESEINKRGGVSIEKQLAVPYTEEDSYAALIKTVDKINYGKIFDEDKESKAMLFGIQQSVMARALNFKGYAYVEAIGSDASMLYLKVKKANADAIIEELFNLFTDILEKDYTKTTTTESLIARTNVKGQDVETAVYGSDEYNKIRYKNKNRGSTWSGVITLIVGLVMFLGAASGNYVLRGTNSSEALLVVSLLVMAYGGYKIYSATKSNDTPNTKNPQPVKQNTKTLSEKTSKPEPEKRKVQSETTTKAQPEKRKVQSKTSPAKTSNNNKTIAIVAIAAIALIAIVGFGLINSGSDNTYSDSSYNSGQPGFGSSVDLSNTKIMITDAHNDKAGWCFVWGYVDPIPADSDYSMLRTYYYDAKGKIITYHDSQINQSSQVGDSYILDGCDVDKKKVAEVSVTLYDSAHNNVTTATSKVK
ncbi:hypothetical protein [uncultured Methanobrevibacter sp.]|uniref:hypothetical protein n=1 Tax=uncultured Methanobrevibacter sp. TaxID=253161 RepID=UPI0025E3F0C3|nr:hypothetical protein [uncultured Methanobrevibacter sp.]